MDRSIAALIEKVRHRIRWQHALDGLVTGGVVCLLIAASLIFLIRLHVIGRGTVLPLLALAFCVPLAAGAARALQCISAATAAKRIDDSHRLRDRVGSAYAFSLEPQPSAFMRAHIAETLSHVPHIQPRRAVPMRRPQNIKLLGAATCCALVMLALRFPGPPTGGTPEVVSGIPITLDPNALDTQRTSARRLTALAMRHDQPGLQRVAQRLSTLIDKLYTGQLTRERVFAELADLERTLIRGVEGDFERLRRHLAQMGSKLAAEDLTRELAKALEQSDFDASAQQLTKLAGRINSLTKSQREDLARALANAGAAPSSDQRIRHAIERLRAQMGRLKRRLDHQVDVQQTRRRLEQKRRQLRRLNQSEQQEESTARQLKRLNQELHQAAANLHNHGDPTVQQALREAAGELRRFAGRSAKLRMLHRAREQLLDLKELLRRTSQENSARARQLQQFRVRSGVSTSAAQSPGGKPTSSGLRGADLREIQQSALSGATEQDGVGTGTDAHTSSNSTDIQSQRRDVSLGGTEQDGVIRSEIIEGAAGSEGFRTRGYRRAYRIYHQASEDDIRRADVPPMKRYHVKRYFELIKPPNESPKRTEE